jgi:hypothetical protein
VRELLSNPIVQSSALPFLVGLVAAGILFPLRLAGLAAAAGFAATVFAVGNFAFEPLTAARKIVLLGAAAAVFGALADLAFRPTRFTGMVLGALSGAAALWVFASILSQKSALDAAILGAGLVAFTAWLVAATVALHYDAVRAGAASLGLGLGAGFASVLGFSALFGQYGIALGAASGAFLLLVMVLGARVAAGVTLTLTVSVLGALVAAGAVLQAKLHPAALAALALVPVLVRLPLPRAAAWMQSVVAGVYALVAAGGACALAWMASRGWTI